MDGDFFSYTRHEPVGVCGQIIPVSASLSEVIKGVGRDSAVSKGAHCKRRGSAEGAGTCVQVRALLPVNLGP